MIFGTLMLAAILGGAAGPWVTGVLHDTTGVPVGSGRGSCVEDTYRTVRAHYHEVACLVDGQRASTVVVAAATTTAWPRMAGELHRALAAFRT